MNRRFLSSVIVMLMGISATAQDWDFSTWTRLKAKGELIKKFELSIEQQLRLHENSTALNETFTELGVAYDLPKGFGISAAYRLGFEPLEEGGVENQHRYNVDLTYGKKFWKLRAKIRARFQHSPNASNFNERLKPDDDPIHVRLKISLSYNDLKRLTPGIAYEVYFLTNDPIESGANKFRYRAFLNYKISKRHEVGGFYMLQTAYTSATPQFDSVLGINYSYTWKRPKKKKKKK